MEKGEQQTGRREGGSESGVKERRNGRIIGEKEEEKAVCSDGEGSERGRVQGQRSGFLGSLRYEVRKGCLCATNVEQ